MRFWIALAAGLVLSADVQSAPSPKAAAKSDPAWSACTTTASAELKMAGCNEVIGRGASETAVRRATAYNNLGNQLNIKGDYDAALRNLNAAVLIDPKMSNGYLNRGASYRGKGDLDSALSDFNKSVELDLKNASAYANRGGLFINKRNYDAALRDIDLAITLNPKLAFAYSYRSIVRNVRNDTAGALEDAERSIAIDPNYSPAYVSRGVALFGRSDTARAFESFDKALALNPRLLVAYNDRGFAFLNSGDWRRAMTDFEEAIRINPKYAHAMNGRGLAFKAAGNLTSAISDFDDAIRLDGKFAAAYAHRGDTYLKLGDIERAQGDLDTAIRLDPSLNYAHASRGLLYERAGDTERARKEFQATVDSPLRSMSLASRAAHELARARLGGVKPTLTPAAVEQATPPKPQPAVSSRLDLRNERGPRVALVIGNAAYREVSPLPNPTNDARLITQELRDLGFKVIEGHDLDANAMRAKVAEFGKAMTGAGVTMLFYAGHGMQVAGKNYLIPVDAKLERPSSLATETIEVGTILADMEAERRVNLVFLDACRDNPMAAKIARSLGASRSSSVNQGLSQQSAGIGTLIAFATSPDTVALDGAGADSPFTLAIVKHIRTPGLEIRSMLTRVRADVIEATREQQVPWDHSSLTGEFFFRP